MVSCSLKEQAIDRDMLSMMETRQEVVAVMNVLGRAEAGLGDEAIRQDPGANGASFLRRPCWILVQKGLPLITHARLSITVVDFLTANSTFSFLSRIVHAREVLLSPRIQPRPWRCVLH